MKETLSDKRKELFDIMIKKMPTAGRIYRIIKQQDREFINQLKGVLLTKGRRVNRSIIKEEIDNLCGSNLSGGEND